MPAPVEIAHRINDLHGFLPNYSWEKLGKILGCTGKHLKKCASGLAEMKDVTVIERLQAFEDAILLARQLLTSEPAPMKMPLPGGHQPLQIVSGTEADLIVRRRGKTVTIEIEIQR